MAKKQSFGEKVGNAKKNAKNHIKIVRSSRSNKTGALRFNDEIVQIPEGKSADALVKELLAKIYIVDHCNFTNKVVLFDEGLIQRLNFLIKLKKKNSGLIKDYLKIMPKSDFLIYLDNFEKKLLNRSLVRKKKFNGFEYKNYSEIYNYKKFFKIVYKEILKSGNYIVK